MKIYSIKKQNYSWELDKEKRFINNDNEEEFDQGTMTLGTDLEHNFLEYDNETVLKSVIKMEMELVKNEPFASYKVEYEVITSANEETKNKVKNEEEEIDFSILHIIEPYFRFDISRTLFDSDLPERIVPYQFWKMAKR